MIQGMTRMARLVLELMHQEYSDTYKALYGVRPRVGIDEWSPAELDARLDELRGDLRRELAKPPTSGLGWTLVPA